MKKKLYRDVQEGALSGVCAGLGNYLEIDKTWIRLAFVLSVIFASWLGLGMLGPIAYIVLWIVVPARPVSGPSTWYGDSEQSPYDIDYRVDSENLGHRGTGETYDRRRRGHPNYQEDDLDFAEETGSWMTWEEKEKPKGNSGRDRITAGSMLVLVGLVFLLNQLDILSMREVFKYWPVLLIIIGLMVLFGAFSPSEKKASQQSYAGQQTQDVDESETVSDTESDTTSNQSDLPNQNQ